MKYIIIATLLVLSFVYTTCAEQKRYTTGRIVAGNFCGIMDGDKRCVMIYGNGKGYITPAESLYNFNEVRLDSLDDVQDAQDSTKQDSTYNATKSKKIQPLYR